MGQSTKQLLTDAGLLLVRLSGALLAVHGFEKVFAAPEGSSFFEHLAYFERTRFATGVERLGIPLPALSAWLGALSELVGGACVALGVYPRMAACFAAFTMGVAVFVAHAGDSLAEREKAVLYLLPLAAVALLGGGQWRVDRLWRGKTD